jgi:monooxygenase
VILFHGKRRMTVSEWRELWSNHIGESTIGAGVGDDFNTFVTVANATNDGFIDLDWTYSRTRAGEGDPLWMPDRGEIMKAPQHLLKEIRNKDLVPPFSTLVNADDIKKSKVYNWRIWALQVQRKELDKAAESGVVFIGDAVHAMPIFGGEGGNHAMLDAVELSTVITKGKTDISDIDVAEIVRKFYDGAYQRGQGAVKRCLQRFSQFHQPISGWKKVAEMATKREAGSGDR